MITYKDGRELVREHVEVLSTEKLATARCEGRVLAADVESRISSPPFNKAAMDGFAVRADDVEGLPADLSLVGESFAGGWPDFEVGRGECARITTGAPVPEGADMVVMVEHTTELSENRIRMEKLSGANICAEGEDIRQGQVVLRSGDLLTPMRVGLAASAGYSALEVYRRPTVALLCTGTEVVEAHKQPGRGQIFNSNGPMLTALLEPMSEELHYLGLAGDRPEELKDELREALKCDFVVATGGVSMGEYDLVPDTLEELGVETIFHRWSVKPGKPLLLGKHGGTSVFGLPGNPQTCFLAFHVLLRAALGLAAGRTDMPPCFRTGLLTKPVSDKSRRKSFKPCRLEVRDSTNYLEPVSYKGSGDIAHPSAANAYFTIPQGTGDVDEGKQVEFFEV